MKINLLNKKTEYRGFIVASFLLASQGIQLSHAEMFKWVDDQGNIHYSDKQPEIKALSSKKITSDERPEEITSRKANQNSAIGLPQGRLSLQILIPEIRYNWQSEASHQYNPKLGAFYVGKLCSPRGPIKIPEIYTSHPSFLPGELTLSRTVKSVITKLGYDSSAVINEDRLALLLKQGALELTGEISEIDIQACAPLRNSRAYLDAREIGAYSFKKNRVKLSVRWQLKKGGNKELLFETESEGYFDGRRTKNSVPTTILKAMENATYNLLSNDQLVSLLLKSSDSPQAILGEKTKPGQEQSWLSPITQFLPFLPGDEGTHNIQKKVYANTVLQAKVASIFSEINSVKVLMVQMYMEDQKWPLNKEEIGLNDSMFATHKLIYDIAIKHDGSIHVELREDVFGSNKTLHLTPNTDAFTNSQSMHINWSCFSNLDAAILPENCEGV